MTASNSMAAPLLDRFLAGLSRIVHDERPEALSRAITVAELYQDIAPYRRMREVAGIEMHADYEHALIRLLAGEGGYARLEPESAAEELMIEAESSDPDLSAYRKFAACEVRLQLAAPASPAGQPRQSPPEPEPLFKAARPPALAPDPAPAPQKERASAAAPQPETRPAAPAPEPRCGFCGQDLPVDREVRFCPWCGVDQLARECAACGETVEEGWSFCVACGAAVVS